MIQELQRELYPQYGADFEKINLDFDLQLSKAYEVAKDLPKDEILGVVSEILKGVLEQYKPKRKSGKILKIIAMAILKIFKRNESKSNSKTIEP